LIKSLFVYAPIATLIAATYTIESFITHRHLLYRACIKLEHKFD